MTETITFYNTNATAFFNSTVNVDMASLYAPFEKRLAKNARILDLGCGSGRDSKYFLTKGFTVTALDFSEELVALASELTGLNVLCRNFLDIDFNQEFEGIWACASLLHLTPEDLPVVFSKINRSLVPGGIFYLSFKYGNFSGLRNGRYFTDLDEAGLQRLVEPIGSFKIIETFKTHDVRKGRESEMWLNAIIQKQ